MSEEKGSNPEAEDKNENGEGISGKSASAEGKESAEAMGQTLAELKEAIAKKLLSDDSRNKAEKSEKSDKPADSVDKIGEFSEKISALEMQLHAAEVQLEALRNGIKTQYLDDAIILASAKKQKNGGEYKTIFAEMRSKYPAWFGDAAAAPGTKGTGSAMKAGAVSEKNEGVGARLAKKQKSKVTKSFWRS